MTKLRTKTLLHVCFLILCTCKENQFNCLTQAGEKVVQVRKMPYFKRLLLKDNIDVVFQNGTNDSIIAEGHKNYLDGLRTEVRDSVLIIENTNSCQWLKKHPLKVYIGIAHLTGLNIEGYGRIESLDSLAADYFSINVFDVSCQIDLTFKKGNLYIYTNDGAGIQLSGEVSYFFMYQDGFGKTEAKNLRADRVEITHKGPNKIHVFPIRELHATIQNSGDIISHHRPPNVEIEKSGQGQLIFHQ